jgi:2-alkyl-3-oxoalkanoate reductase
MRVFVAGASGVIGKPLVPALVEAGHEVAAMTRSPEKAEALRAAGADPVICDALDLDAVRDAVAAAKPEAVINQLTNLPSAFNPRKVDYGTTNELRGRVGPALAEAAAAAGAKRLIAQSIAFLYAPEGDAVKDEQAPVFLDAPSPFGDALAATVRLEQSTVQTPGLDGLVLRYGWFYGPGTYFAADGSTAAEVRKRRYPVVGDGGGVNSWIHVDDAAAATVTAIEHGAPGIYNVVDDEPAALRDWLPVYAEALGAKPPRRVPKLLARLVAGRFAAEMSTTLRGASNEKVKRELGWQPRYPSWRQGFAEALG